MDDLQARLAAALAHRYRVERELGRGGMALVFLAWDLRNERHVALKVLRPELSAALGPERFQREVRVVARLKHPYILKLHDSGETGGLLYYDMPYVEGASLRQILAERQRLSLAEALRITQEVAEALDYAHRHDVIHRDIKPENILFEENHAIVSDFGIALAVSKAGTPLERNTGTDTVLGTVDYMSPEQEQKLPDIDGRTDIYSLGLVLYEMLTGDLPGPDRGVDSLTGRRADVPNAVVSILRRMLARDPRERFASAGELATALAQLTRSPVRARIPARKVLIGAGAAAAAVAAVLWMWPRRPVRPLDPTHVAVLYFEDLTPDRRLGHIANGLTHDLIEALTRLPGLRVISPDGIRPYRTQVPPLDSLARLLNVGTIVTGSVAESRQQLRVEVRLIDPETGAQLAGETFQRRQGELFALQDSLAAEVSTALRERLGREIGLREQRAEARIPEAWELLQRATDLREESQYVTTDDPGAATTLLVRADSLAALAGRTDRRWISPLVLRGWIAYDLSGVPMRGNPVAGTSAGVTTLDWLQRATAYADSALALQPADPTALTLRGSVRIRRWFVEGPTGALRLDDAERDLRAAVAQPTGARARAWGALSGLLQMQGKMEQAYYAARRAYEADAFLVNAAEIVYRLFFASFQLDRVREAVDWCETGRTRFPQDWFFLHCKLALMGSGGARADVAEAWRLAHAVRDIAPAQHRGWVAPRLQMMAATVIARAGLRDSAERVIRVARAAAPADPEMLYLEALARIRLEQPDSAVALLAANLRASPDARAFLRNDIQLRPLANYRGFRTLVSESGTATP